jgi:RNA-dependent RNA polymerase
MLCLSFKQIDVPRALRVKEYPHYMEREKFPSYHSSSVLGKMYDEAKAMDEQSENIPAISKLLFLVCSCQFVLSITPYGPVFLETDPY